MKFDKTFWVNTGMSLAILLLGLFIYDQVKMRMATKSAGNTADVVETEEVEEEA